MKSVLPGLAACLLCATATAAPAAYRLDRTIALGAPDRWDYVVFNAASRRVLVAHGDHTDVIDAGSLRVVGKLGGLHGAHGQAVAPDGVIYADSGQTATLTGFDPVSFKPVATLAAGTDADAVIFEPTASLVAVMDGDGQSATFVDTATRTVKATVALGGSPEFAAADGAGHVYVNIESSSEIARVDVAGFKVTARVEVPGCQSPHGLAIDPATHRLFTTCVNARLMVVDLDRLTVSQTLPIGHGTDAAAFDPVRHRVFSSNGDGTLSVFDETADGRLAASATIRTAPGARTMAVDPRSGRVYLVSADIDPTRPPVSGPHGSRPAFRPGSVKLLVLDPS